MPEAGIRSTYSQCPFQILMCDNEGLISTGTAFYYEYEKNTYIITNWHNVSGKNPYDQNISSKRLPTYIFAKFSTYIDIKSQGKFTSLPTKIEIYNSDLSETKWIEHPILGSGCDIVAIPFKKPAYIPDMMHHSANKISKVRIPIQPGSSVFAIGFPRNLSVGFGLPLWKSGYIASEPHYDVTWGGQPSAIGGMAGGTDIPAIFIDILTREGMSGAPVFAQYIGNWDMTDPYRPVDPTEPNFLQRNDIAIGGSAMEFIGIYSGRAPTNEKEAALGFCWKETAIIEICRAGVAGKHPHL